MKAKYVLAVWLLSFGAAQLHAQTVNLTDLPIIANKESDKDQIVPDDVKKSCLFLNKTQDGKPLMIGDKTYPNGIEQIHGSLSWSYKLDGAYTSLVMDLGQEGNATLQVLGDDKLLYDSGKLPNKAPITAMVDVRGDDTLRVDVQIEDATATDTRSGRRLPERNTSTTASSTTRSRA